MSHSGTRQKVTDQFAVGLSERINSDDYTNYSDGVGGEPGASFRASFRASDSGNARIDWPAGWHNAIDGTSDSSAEDDTYGAEHYGTVYNTCVAEQYTAFGGA